MAKKAYIGVDGIASKVKTGYVGVNVVAHKIKKAYIGIGGVARPCWGSGKPEYYGTTTQGLLGGGTDMVGFSVGNYGVFGGGNYPTAWDDIWNGNPTYSPTATTTAYDKSLTRTQPPPLSVARYSAKAATINNSNAVVTGGAQWVYYDDAGYPEYGFVSATEGYDASLTRTTSSGVNDCEHTGASVGDYAIFSGRRCNIAYNASLTGRHVSAYKYSKANPGGASVGGYAIFVCGEQYNEPTNTVDVYDTSLTLRTATEMGYHNCAVGVSTGNHAIFAGGGTSSSLSKSVVAYDAALTMTVLANASDYSSRTTPATAIGGFALFGFSNITDVYDTSLTKTTIPKGRGSANTAAHAGDFALFAGGSYAEVTYDEETWMEIVRYGFVELVSVFALV